MSTSRFIRDLLKPLKHSDECDDLNRIKNYVLLQESEDDVAISDYWRRIIEKRTEGFLEERKMQPITQKVIANVEVINVNKGKSNDVFLEEKARKTLT